MTHHNISRKPGQQPLSQQEIAERKAHIIQAGLTVAKLHGFRSLLREDVARKAQVAAGTINRYFGTMECLRNCVMLAAIQQRELKLVAQGLAAGNEVALGATGEIRAAAVAAVGGDL